jgi:hypothetical protein
MRSPCNSANGLLLYDFNNTIIQGFQSIKLTTPFLICIFQNRYSLPTIYMPRRGDPCGRPVGGHHPVGGHRPVGDIHVIIQGDRKQGDRKGRPYLL